MEDSLPPFSGLRVLPLGGLGEVGMNMLALEYGGKLLLIDCGLMFPEAHMPGIDLVLPDISSLQQRQDDILGLILTHGHEDHIGALPYLYAELGAPDIYATPLTLGLVANKLEEHGFDCEHHCRLQTVTAQDSLHLGPFLCEFFHMAHSIVDGIGLAIDTPLGRIVHTGDFKLDQTPVDGRMSDLPRLAAYGQDGVLLLLSDSTNVERPGLTLSEKAVGEAFSQLLPNCSGRIYVATFSSNIHRMQQVVEAAAACGRKVLISGRSMEQNSAIAQRLGYLQLPPGTLVGTSEALQLPREQLLVLTTGSQGEPRSTLTRMAHNEHKNLNLEPGDTVILSSKFIPGNEKAIFDLINMFYRQGAHVHYETTSDIHVSGHASREELKLVLNLVRPRYFVPIHGEIRHLSQHGHLAEEVGLPPENVFVLENGQTLQLDEHGACRGPQCYTGRVLVDGKGVGDISSLQLRDRRHLANHGLVVVLLALAADSGTILYGPEILHRGFVPEAADKDYLQEAKAKLEEVLKQLQCGHSYDWDDWEVEVRKALRRFFNRTIERRPLILPVILQL